MTLEQKKIIIGIKALLLGRSLSLKGRNWVLRDNLLCVTAKRYEGERIRIFEDEQKENKHYIDVSIHIPMYFEDFIAMLSSMDDETWKTINDIE